MNREQLDAKRKARDEECHYSWTRYQARILDGIPADRVLREVIAMAWEMGFDYAQENPRMAEGSEIVKLTEEPLP